MPEMSAVSVSPTRAVPLMAGAPVAGLLVAFLTGKILICMVRSPSAPSLMACTR